MSFERPDDDLRWSQLPHYFAGELPPEQLPALQAWIDAEPQRRFTVARLQEVWRVASRPPQRWDVEAELERLRADGAGLGAERRAIVRTGPRLAPLSDTRVVRWRRVARLAAAVVIAAGAAVLWKTRPALTSGPAELATATVEYRTGAGQRLTTRLPDGTEVMLAPGSVLRRSASYGHSRRDLQLEGEAYFVVTHDANRPFVVRTAHAVAHDLGTRFVMRAYPEDAEAEVVVTEGLVAVKPSTSADSAVLTASQRARVTGRGHIEVTPEAAVDEYVGWTKGRLVFAKAPLREVVRRLERWYGVDIRLADPSLGGLRVTVTLSHESPQQAIDLVADVLELAVSRSAGGYVIGRW